MADAETENLYIDCEWNGAGGELISMALVSKSTGKSFYAVLGCDDPVPWVAVNVMPVLGMEPVSKSYFQIILGVYLRQFDRPHIIADWPEDIARFCNALITGPGEMLNVPAFTIEYKEIKSVSDMPHNALRDAYANMVADSDRD